MASEFPDIPHNIRKVVTFRVLFVFVVLAHHRRRVVYFNVTANPSSEWTARQTIGTNDAQAERQILLLRSSKRTHFASELATVAPVLTTLHTSIADIRLEARAATFGASEKRRHRFGHPASSA